VVWSGNISGYWPIARLAERKKESPMDLNQWIRRDKPTLPRSDFDRLDQQALRRFARRRGFTHMIGSMIRTISSPCLIYCHAHCELSAGSLYSATCQNSTSLLLI